MRRIFSLVLIIYFVISFANSASAEIDPRFVASLARLEANYILACQYNEPLSPGYGAINNIYGDPTWVVPRENAMAILGLIRASQILHNNIYLNRAQLCADYLIQVQDDTDGAWYDQYEYETPIVLSKSPTQTAEVMIALHKLGYDSDRYPAMRNGALYLMECQDVVNKGGNDDGLVAGGKDEQGIFRSWRWSSDNAYSYVAFRAAQEWAILSSDLLFAEECSAAAEDIINGINTYLYIDETSNPDFGVWFRVLDMLDQPIDPGFHDWINYAPQMLDVPCVGVGNAAVGNWIHNNLQAPDGACVWDNSQYNNRKSPGYSFQASLCWIDLRQSNYLNSALRWAMHSGLWQQNVDPNGIRGGWIDWIENGIQADWWLRFIDTSFYSIAAVSGGYNFNIVIQEE